MQKRILIITAHKLYPSTTGGSYYQLAYLEKQMHDFDITIIITPDNIAEQDIESFKNQFYKLKIVKIGSTKSIGFNKVKNSILKLRRKIGNGNWVKKLRKIPKVSELVIKDPALVQEIVTIANTGNYDIIQVDQIINVALVSLLPKSSLKVFIEYETFFTRALREMKQLNYNSHYTKYIEDLVKGIEVSCLNQFDGVITLAEQDKVILLEAGVKTPISSNHCIAIKKSELKKTFSPSASPDILFLGSEDHFPNKEGMIWFLKEVYPLIIKQEASAKLKMTGNWSREFQEQFKHLPIEYTGFVDSVEPLLNTCILIVPIRIGGGIRIKMLSAISKGTPIVSTLTGAGGVPYIKHGVDMFITDEPSQYATHVLELLSNQDLRKQISENVFATAEKISEHGDFVTERISDYEEFEKIKFSKSGKQL